jgi:hypothetical protein
MVAAGGTERDIDVLAVFLVLLVIADTECGSFDRQDLIERIADHIACTSMVVRIGQGDDYLAVEFPDRPLIHRSFAGPNETSRNDLVDSLLPRWQRQEERRDRVAHNPQGGQRTRRSRHAEDRAPSVRGSGCGRCDRLLGHW